MIFRKKVLFMGIFVNVLPNLEDVVTDMLQIYHMSTLD